MSAPGLGEVGDGGGPALPAAAPRRSVLEENIRAALPGGAPPLTPVTPRRGQCSGPVHPGPVALPSSLDLSSPIYSARGWSDVRPASSNLGSETRQRD